jgi:serine phosphatase RsbU (regulator of sigma subunit)
VKTEQAAQGSLRAQAGQLLNSGSSQFGVEGYMYMERVKEQELVYNLFNILGSNLYLKQTLQLVAEEIPNGTQFPAEIRSRLTFDGVSFYSSGFAESSTCIQREFRTFGSKSGKIEVYYLSQSGSGKLQLSLTNAQNLVDCIAKLLQGWLNKYETENRLRNMLVELEAKIEEKTYVLNKANSILNEVNKEIKDSISYANRIQRAVLPTTETIRSQFEDAFVLYKPKDIVSGDFYWTHHEGNKVFLVCADCTGHGVPGALMSMVGTQLLDHIVTDKKISDPDRIMNEMDKSIARMFRNETTPEHLRDGMAISLCVVDKSTNRLSFAGACNNAYLVRNNQVILLRADRHSLGGTQVAGGKSFIDTELDYHAGDQVYMLTDGFPDQNGGPKGKKFLRNKLIKLIMEIGALDHHLQKQVLESYLAEWKEGHFQIDDITVMGIKL